MQYILPVANTNIIMHKTPAIWLVVALMLCGRLPAQPNNAAAKKPNIIFILADDLGYGDLACYNANNKIPTPNIDALALGGIRFTRFYAGSTVCAPSRCALMTGLHTGHAYIRGNADDVSLRPQDTTLAQRLQAIGYTMGMCGKWGLGERNSTGEPQLKGFDYFFGYLNQVHAHQYFTDSLFEAKDGRLNKINIDSTTYTDDLIVGAALNFIKSNATRPFFLYLPVTIPHAELRVPDSLMRPFLNDDGSSKLGPEKPYTGSKLARYGAQPMPHAAFAAMITKLDNNVAQVVQLVKQLGLDDNTCIIFSSDNGPHAEGGGDPQFFNSSGPLRGIKRDLYEGGIRVPFIVKLPGAAQAPQTNDEALAFWDIMPTLCGLTGAAAPEGIDGLSFLPLLTGGQIQPHKYLYWQFSENGVFKEAVMQGHWKLIRLKAEGKREILQLYNVSDDMAEQNNLAAANAGKVAELKTLMQQAKTPPENPKFDYSELEK
jgi:arylsulfatase A-like enzyme